MSVATGMPQPLVPVVPRAMAVKIKAGTSMPPAAAIAGSRARRISLSCPTTNSRLISMPTTKKNAVISPSLIQRSRAHSSRCPATLIPIFCATSQW